MGDTISRQAAIDALDGEITVTGRANAEAVRGYANLVCDRIKRLPSAQPERKTGKWIEVDDYYNRISGRCSVCGWESHLYEDDVVGMNFCPNCGARMDGGEQDG